MLVSGRVTNQDFAAHRRWAIRSFVLGIGSFEFRVLLYAGASRWFEPVGRWVKIVTFPETNSKFAPKNGWFGILSRFLLGPGLFLRGRTVSFRECRTFGDVGYVGMDFSPMLDVETTRSFEVPRGGQMCLRLVGVLIFRSSFCWHLRVLTGKLTNFPWKSMVGRCISYWNSPLKREHVSLRGCRVFFSLPSSLSMWNLGMPWDVLLSQAASRKSAWNRKA